MEAFFVPGLHNTTVLKAAYKQQRFAAHTHPTYVIALITAEALRFECERQSWTAPVGSICLINPGEVQTGEPAASEGWAYWSAYLSAESLASLTDERRFASGAPLFPARVVADDLLRGLLERFFVMIRTVKLPLAQAELSSEYLSPLLAQFGMPSEGGYRSDPVLVRTVKDYLSSHFSDPVSLSDAASIVGITGFHLTRTFKLTTGLTMHAWLVQHRVERAREMLLQGFSAADTAVACGFSDQPHMARWLRRILGMTPRDVQSMSRTFKIGAAQPA